MASIKILIVEDENIVAKDIRTTLEKLGYEIVGVASTGEDAIERAAVNKPDLVLMDIMLKGNLDGIEASEQIRSRFDIPIVYLTAYSDEDLLKKAKSSEAFSYLIKPFKESELHTVIEIASHQHRMEKKLRESLVRYQAVVEDQTELICRFNADFEVTFINGAYCGYLAREQDDIVGGSYLSLLRDEERENIRKKLSGLTPESPVISLEQKLFEPFKETHWQQFNHRALFDYHGNLVEYQSVGQDITDRKKAELALKESEERFRVLFENIPMTVLIHDDFGVILHVNELCIKQLGWGVEKLIGSNISRIKPKNQGKLNDFTGIYDSGTRKYGTTFKTSKGNLIKAEVWESKITYMGNVAYLNVISILT